ncbi:MAG: hypothetical protein DRR19_17360 [Candidatus Parabeggiatoa sp. nov. 1]|nr:MAG: hypothetical protein DRR19_17360 [Gammaproteobacteria bacterium]
MVKRIAANAADCDSLFLNTTKELSVCLRTVNAADCDAFICSSIIKPLLLASDTAMQPIVMAYLVMNPYFVSGKMALSRLTEPFTLMARILVVPASQGRCHGRR